MATVVVAVLTHVAGARPTGAITPDKTRECISYANWTDRPVMARGVVAILPPVAGARPTGAGTRECRCVANLTFCDVTAIIVGPAVVPCGT